VAHDFAGFNANDDDFGARPDPEIARLVLELARTMMRRRRAAGLRQIPQGQPVPLPVQPARLAPAVFTALAQTGDPAIPGAGSGPVLGQVAECGAVVGLQQVVFAKPASTGVDDRQDGRIAARRQDARPRFGARCRRFPGACLAGARARLARFTTPPASSSGSLPDSSPDAHGEGYHG
jgi:hypothetical protein